MADKACITKKDLDTLRRRINEINNDSDTQKSVQESICARLEETNRVVRYVKKARKINPEKLRQAVTM